MVQDVAVAELNLGDNEQKAIAPREKLTNFIVEKEFGIYGRAGVRMDNWAFLTGGQHGSMPVRFV
jgi:hypothetical protein